ncbi:MAG: glycosyltransferase family 39 protein [Desulfobaccales bacterium]
MGEKEETTGRQRPDPVSAKDWVKPGYAWGLVGFILLVDIALRVHLLGVPLERDEGEYAYAGQLILQGFLPYAKVYTMKLPGIYGAYALMMAILGQTLIGIHLGLMLVNLATIIFIFLLGKQLVDRTTGIIAAASFAVLSVGQSVQGMVANTEHFVILPAMAGMLVLLRATDSPRSQPLFLSGLLFGIAFLMKQHGAAFIAFALVYLIYQGWSTQSPSLKLVITNILIFLAGAALPFTLICLFFFADGTFDKFWFWTFTYAREYVSLTSPAQGWENFLHNFRAIVFSAPLLWVLAGWGLLALIIDPRARPRLFFFETLVIFSFLATVPGFYFRPHYFVLVLPAVSLLIGLGLSSMGRLLANAGQITAKLVPVVIILSALGFTVYQQSHFLFGVDPVMASRLMYQSGDPFPESLKIAQYLKERTSSEDTIAVMGSEPQIYFYAHRHAATGYIYTYPLMEREPYAVRMQEEMIREIEASRPAYLVFVAFPESLGTGPDSPGIILDWFRRYSSDFYDCVGVVEVNISPNLTKYNWAKGVKGCQPSSHSVYVYKRKRY